MGKKKQTIGYWYKYLLHYGLTRGPVDAVLEMRAGDRTAWSGRATGSQQVYVDKLNLFGGERAEGGLQGYMDIMMGESTQMPNQYLIDNMGPEQSGLRGKLSLLWRGGVFGAMSAYPKAVAVKIERILADWPGDEPWYPEKAAIEFAAPVTTGQISGFWRVEAGSIYTLQGEVENYGVVAESYVATADEIGQMAVAARNATAGASYVFAGSQLTSLSGDPAIVAWAASHGPNVGIAVVKATPVCPSGYTHTYVEGPDLTDEFDAPTVMCSLSVGQLAMNPAHMLYESIIARVEDGGQGEPVGLINAASFTAAADKLFDEGFGLCTTWDGEESAEEFQDRICNVIGASLSQSRVDGQYYLDLIRDDYVLADLPVITEDDIIDIVEEPTNLSEAINQVQVGWFDPQAKENRLTPPLSSLGGIQAAGGVIAESFTHREIPAESIATRVAARYLAMKSRPLSRYSLTTNRRPYALRPGKFFRLQVASEGIGDVVCLAGEIDYGELANGRMKIVALQDVFGLPSAVFVDPGTEVVTDVDPTPVASANQRVFEAPYVEVAATLSHADLAALPDDAGFLATVATRPSGSGLNYAIHTAADAEAYVDRGAGDWCPSALIVESVGPLDTSFTLSGGSDLDQVVVGSWALWGDELVRVDAIDDGAGTLTVGRGCGDTVPVSHDAAERIYFAGDWAGTDQREYVDAEVVHAKLLTRTSGDLFDIAAAVDNTVTMAQRAVRPYPPGGLTVNAEAYPAAQYGALTAAWEHRDRSVQADQLVDATAASIGPEEGTTYTVRWYSPADTLLSTEADVSATASTPYTPPTSPAVVRVEVEAIRGGFPSWQAAAHTFDWAASPPALLITEDGTAVLITEDGASRLITE